MPRKKIQKVQQSNVDDLTENKNRAGDREAVKNIAISTGAAD
jgi:hypothetical protein